MRSKKDISAPCIIQGKAIDSAQLSQRVSVSDADFEEFTIVESVGKLLTLGLSMKEINDLDVAQPLLQAICEYARLDIEGDLPDCSYSALQAAIGAVQDQLKSLQMEIEMLNMAEEGPERRASVMDKLAASLEQDGNGPLDQ